MRLVDWFFQVGDILAFMYCSMIVWAAAPNASFASFWSSSRKPINFWFAGLKTSRWNLGFAVAIEWGFTYFLRKTVWNSPKFSLLGLVMFLKVCSASPRMREWKQFIVFFCHLGVDFQTCLEQIFKEFDFLRFPIERGHCCAGREISRFCWLCCWNWLNYCSSPSVEGLTVSSLL